MRYDILRIYGLAKVGAWEEIRHIYAARKNIVPIEVGSLRGFDVVLLAGRAREEGLQRGRLLSERDEREGLAGSRAALRFAAQVGMARKIDRSQWTLATKLAVQLNDYSSIIIIMDSVGNDVPGIRVGLRLCVYF